MNVKATLILLASLTVVAFSASFESTLEAMKESPIVEPVVDKRIVAYRFTCAPTFQHPFSIKIFSTKTGFVMTRKVLSGLGGWDPGVLKEVVKSDVTAEAVEELDNLLRSLKFDQLPSTVEWSGFDGSLWSLEVVKSGSYKKVERWALAEGEALEKISKWFLSTAKWKPEPAK